MNKRRYARRAETGGLTQRIRALLAKAPAPGLSLAQISDALDITKLEHPKISSVLSKLDREGILQTTPGPTPQERGPKQVNRYYVTKSGTAGHPRQVITHFTSGSSDCLTNAAGDRRFWPLLVPGKGGAE